MFTRKHYRFIAKEINYRRNIIIERKERQALLEIDNFIYQLRDSFFIDSNNFDMERFVNACQKQDK